MALKRTGKAVRNQVQPVRRFNSQKRRGRQEEGEAPPPPAEGGDEASADEEGGDVPEWCDPAKPMGAWLNYMKIRVVCSDRGYTNFGPYGGVPSADEGGDENEVDEAAEEAA